MASSGAKVFDEDDMPGISDYMCGKTVFITGATGFLGKILIEKILRSCPGVQKVYILVRPKKGLSLVERLEKMSKIPLFEKLHSEHPGDFQKKVIPLAGDVAQLNLGLSAEDEDLLINNVHIIFHVAASVRFDQPLKDAILMNTRGTREMCNLALKMKSIEIVMHISTAYTQCHNNKVIEERMYPAEVEWRGAIEIAEQMDVDDLQIVSKKYMGGQPNTYTFTKAIAENVVYDLLNDKIPNCIMRPSIVVSTHKDPVPGWIDNFNGPVGLLAAGATGLVRINLISNINADFVCADLVIKCIIAAMWKKMVKSSPNEVRATVVYNCSANGVRSLTMEELIHSGLKLHEETPLSTCIWNPSTKTTTSVTIYYIYVMLFHLIPAMILDTLLKLVNKKPMLVKIQRRIFNATMTLKFFLFNEWKFANDRSLNMEEEILAKDKEAFSYFLEELDTKEFFQKAIFGAKKYLLKENMDEIDKHARRLTILYYLDMLLNVVLVAGGLYLFFYTLNVPSIALNSMYGYLNRI